MIGCVFPKHMVFPEEVSRIRTLMTKEEAITAANSLWQRPNSTIAHVTPPPIKVKRGDSKSTTGVTVLFTESTLTFTEDYIYTTLLSVEPSFRAGRPGEVVVTSSKSERSTTTVLNLADVTQISTGRSALPISLIGPSVTIKFFPQRGRESTFLAALEVLCPNATTKY
jgi:hypothetical protein